MESCAFMGYTHNDGAVFQFTYYIVATLLLALSLPTVLVNIAIVTAIIFKRELRTPAYLVIANLAISDCLAGCFVYPCYSVVCIQLALGNNPCPVAFVGTPLGYIFGLTSYNTIALQTVERYLAVFFPYWYHEKLTTKVIVIANVSTWLLSLSIVTLWLITKDNQIFNGILGPLSAVAFCVTVVSYVRIFREVRKIEKQIKEQQVGCSAEQRKIKSESKVAKATAIILLAVVVCYSPLLIFEFVIAFVNIKSSAASVSLYWWWFLAIGNSSINPYIACRQLSALRRSVKNMFRWLPIFGRKIESVDQLTSFAPSRTSQTDLKRHSLFTKNN